MNNKVQSKLFSTKEMFESRGWKCTAQSMYSPMREAPVFNRTEKQKIQFWAKYFSEDKAINELALMFGYPNRCECGREEWSIVWKEPVKGKFVIPRVIRKEKQLELFSTREMMEASGWKCVGAGCYSPIKRHRWKREILTEKEKVLSGIELLPDEGAVNKLAVMFGKLNFCKCCHKQELSLIWNNPEGGAVER